MKKDNKTKKKKQYKIDNDKQSLYFSPFIKHNKYL